MSNETDSEKNEWIEEKSEKGEKRKELEPRPKQIIESKSSQLKRSESEQLKQGEKEVKEDFFVAMLNKLNTEKKKKKKGKKRPIIGKKRRIRVKMKMQRNEIFFTTMLNKLNKPKKLKNPSKNIEKETISSQKIRPAKPIKTPTTKEDWIEHLKRNPMALEHAPEKFRDDEDVVIAGVNIMRDDVEFLKFASKRLLQDKSFIISVIGRFHIAEYQFDSLIDVVGVDQVENERDVFIAVANLRPRDRESFLRHASDKIRNNKEVVFESSLYYSGNMSFASDELKKDKEFAYKIIEFRERRLAKSDKSSFNNSKDILGMFYSNVKNDRDLQLSLIQLNGEIIGMSGFKKEFLKDREFVSIAVKSLDAKDGRSEWSFEKVSDELKSDREFILSLLRKEISGIFEHVSDDLKKDKEVARLAVRLSRRNLKFVNSALKENEDFLLSIDISENETDEEKVKWIKLVRNDPMTLEKAPEKYQGDRDVVLAGVSEERWLGSIEFLQFASDELLNDKDFILTVVTRILQFGPKTGKHKDNRHTACDMLFDKVLDDENHCARSDREIILKMVRIISGGCFRHASDGLKDDREFALESLKKAWDNGTFYCALNDVSERLRNDRNFVLGALQIEGGALEYLSDDLKRDKEVVLAAVEQNGESLKFACEELRDDREVVMTSLTSLSMRIHALKFASIELRSDREFILAAVKKFEGQNVMKDVREDFRNDREFVLEAIRGACVDNFTSCFEPKHEYLMGDGMENDSEIMIALLRRNQKGIKYLGHELKNDPKFFKSAIQEFGKDCLKYASQNVQDLLNDKEEKGEREIRQGRNLLNKGREEKEDFFTAMLNKVKKKKKSVKSEESSNIDEEKVRSINSCSNTTQVQPDENASVGKSDLANASKSQNDVDVPGNSNKGIKNAFGVESRSKDLVDGATQGSSKMKPPPLPSRVSRKKDKDRDNIQGEQKKKPHGSKSSPSEQTRKLPNRIPPKVPSRSKRTKVQRDDLGDSSKSQESTVIGSEMEAKMKIMEERLKKMEDMERKMKEMEKQQEKLKKLEELELKMKEVERAEAVRVAEVMRERIRRKEEKESFQRIQDEKKQLESERKKFEEEKLKFLERQESNPEATLREEAKKVKEEKIELKKERREVEEQKRKNEEERRRLEEERMRLAEESLKREEDYLKAVIKKKELKVDSIKVEKKKKLGSGGDGSVFSGVWEGFGGGIPVAVKEVKVSLKEGEEFNELEHLKEFGMTMECNHTHVMRVFGYTLVDDTDGGGGKKLQIVMEQMYTSVKEYVIKRRAEGNPLSWKDKLSIMKKMAQAIQFLHGELPPQKLAVLHRDIKPDNFLISKDGMQVKIADLGLAKSKTFIETKVLAAEAGSEFYQAPEIFSPDIPEDGTDIFEPNSIFVNSSKYSKESDIYALGISFSVILNEYVTPFEGYFKQHPEDDELAVLDKVSDPESNWRPALKKNVPKKFKELLAKCWCRDRGMRMTACGIIKWIEANETRI